jgi:hypothetical protein
MSKNYTVKDFFRQMPNDLLGRYFESRGVVHGLDVSTLKEAKPEPWLALWGDVPEAKRADMEADFRDIYAMGNEKGSLAIVDELKWQMQGEPDAATAIVESLAGLNNHYHRAMAAFLDHPTCWPGATRLHHADGLGYWRKHKNLPKKDAAVDPASIDEFSRLISVYFHHTEGRGKHCVVEPYRRGERDYFFAYPEDYSQRSPEWVDGQFQPRPHNPAFEVVFVYTKAEGSLDISFKGVKKSVEALQGIFAQAILKLDEMPPDLKDDRVYDLAPLAEKAFEFNYPASSGIAKVVVKKIRLSSMVRKGDRITLEANTDQDKYAVHHLLDAVKKTLPMHLYNVTLVELSALVTTTPDKPAKKVTISISSPNSCSLKYEALDLKLRDMLASSGIEPKTPEAVSSATEAQTSASV